MEKRKTEVVGKFATPIWTGMVEGFEELNGELIKHIIEIKEHNPQGTKKSFI